MLNDALTPLSDDEDQSRGAALTAHIEHVEIVDQVRSSDGVLTQGLDLLLAHAGSLLGQGQYALYTLRVQHKGGSTTIKKRFSDFDAFHAQLLAAFPSGLAFDLPDKGVVRQFSPEALKDRERALNVYLKTLCRSEHVSQHPVVMSFLGLDSYSRSISGGAGGGGMVYGNQISLPVESPAMCTMSNDARKSRAPFSAQIEGYEIVNAVRSSEGAVTQGLDLLLAHAGSVLGGQGQHALYSVRVIYEGRVTHLKKRFSDFDTFHAELLAAFPTSLSFSLPDKGVLRQFSEDALRDRARALNAYLKELCNSGHVAQHPCVASFFELGLGLYQREAGLNRPSSIQDPQPTGSVRTGADNDDLAGWSGSRNDQRERGSSATYARPQGSQTTAPSHVRTHDDDDDLAGWDG